MDLRRLLPIAAQAPAALIAAAVTGLLVGSAVAGFEWVTQEQAFTWLLGLPIAAQAAAPIAGLVLANVLTRAFGGGSPATSDAFIRAYHQRRADLPLREVPGRLAAGTATIGLGGAMGLEGPAIYTGASIGAAVQRRLGGALHGDALRVLLTAGAAAGVAAIFKTPATGVLFALEAPYRDDIARRALLPALIASATSYLAFIAIAGAEPVIPRLGTSIELNLAVVGGSLLLGVAAGLGGRGFAWLANWAKRVQHSAHVALRIGIAGAILAGLAVATHAAFDAPLSLGAGYEAIEWVRDPTRSLQLVALLLAVRVIATVATVAGGGVGGLFIPLVVQGALLGRLVGGLLGEPNAELYPIVGLAAFLAAGYRTPIAAVMFVAESSFGESYIIPALVAAAVSQIVVGRATVSGYQRSVRQGHLERRLDLTISAALSTDVLTVPPDASVAELVDVHVLGNRLRVVPVVDGSAYLGMVGLPQIGTLRRDEWAAVNVGTVLDADVPVARPSWTLRAATAAMESSGVDVLAVVDDDGRFVGVVSALEIVKLDEILDETDG